MKISLSILLFLTVNICSFAQNKGIPDAFAASYASETKKDYAQAIQDIMEVYDQDSYEINLRLGWLYYYNSGYDESLKYYKLAIQNRPRSIESRLGYVLPASALGDWNKVMAQYMEVLKIDPQNTNVNYFVGLIYFNRQDYVNAEKYFELVLDLYPFNYDNTIILANTKLKLNKRKEAKELYGKALIFYPGDAAALEGIKNSETN